MGILYCIMLYEIITISNRCAISYCLLHQYVPPSSSPLLSIFPLSIFLPSFSSLPTPLFLIPHPSPLSHPSPLPSFSSLPLPSTLSLFPFAPHSPLSLSPLSLPLSPLSPPSLFPISGTHFLVWINSAKYPSHLPMTRIIPSQQQGRNQDQG